jgi:ribosomal protein S14
MAGTGPGGTVFTVYVSAPASALRPDPTLTAQDRCDRCGAQAYLRAVLPGGGDLLFCRHHAREHGEKLRQVAVTVTDETGRLETRATAPLDER